MGCFSFPKANGTLSTLPIGSKNRLLVIKLFGQYCEDEGKPIVNWKQVTKEEFNCFRCYTFDHVAEKLTVHPSFKVDPIPLQTDAPDRTVQAGIDLSLLPFGGRVVEVGGVPEVAGGSIPLLAVKNSRHPYPVPYDGAVRPSV